MATPARPWPNNALRQRDGAAEAVNKAIAVLENGLRARDQSGIYRWIALALVELDTAIRLLEEAGAPTRPMGA